MKSVIGMLAVLLLATTVAFGEQNQPLPFPQAANPALANGGASQASPAIVGEVPSSMAANQSNSYADWSGPATNGSPFPSAANPALGRSEYDLSSPSFQAQHSNGSPFPSAANPSRNQ
jgi:hypothetical protein